MTTNTLKAVFHGAYDYKQGSGINFMEVPANTDILIIEKKNRILKFKQMVEIFNMLSKVVPTFTNSNSWKRITTVKFNTIGDICYNIKHFSPKERIYDQLMHFEHGPDVQLNNALGVYDITRTLNTSTGREIPAQDVNTYTVTMKNMLKHINVVVRAQNTG